MADAEPQIVITHGTHSHKDGKRGGRKELLRDAQKKELPSQVGIYNPEVDVKVDQVPEGQIKEKHKFYESFVDRLPMLHNKCVAITGTTSGTGCESKSHFRARGSRRHDLG